MLGERTWQLLRHVSFSSLAVLLFISDSNAERTGKDYLYLQWFVQNFIFVEVDMSGWS